MRQRVVISKSLRRVPIQRPEARRAKGGPLTCRHCGEMTEDRSGLPWGLRPGTTRGRNRRQATAAPNHGLRPPLSNGAALDCNVSVNSVTISRALFPEDIQWVPGAPDFIAFRPAV